METSRLPGTHSSANQQALKPLSIPELREKLRQICSCPVILELRKALGRDALLHLVGGSVRDAVYQAPLKDFDVASVLHPRESAARLSALGIRTIETGIEHGTITALIDGTHVEITTFRLPGPRNSSLFSTSIQDDLKGRDFTINALAWDVNAGELLDPHGGLSDLENNVLRAVGSAHDRFAEDPHRILRMVRFGPAQNRAIEPQTLEAARTKIALLKGVSIERIQTEFVNILAGPQPAAALRCMLNIGLIAQLLPEMLPSVNCEQNEFHTQDVFEHTLTVLEKSEPYALQRLTALFHDMGKPATLSVGDDGRRHFYEHEVISAKIAEEVMSRLRFSNEITSNVTKLVRTHMRPIECGPPGLRRLLRDLGPLFDEWRKFKIADAPPVYSDEEFAQRLQRFDKMLEDELERQRNSAGSNLVIDGYDIMRLGVPAGPAVGKILRSLEEMIMDDPALNVAEVLLDKAKELLKKEASRTSE